jgi:2-polyprenyl-6-methoxyphenol hydroxylase-like FAD-dependent oxidoreductase
MQTGRPILVVGGGPVGVITAFALARQGIPVQVFEAEARVNDSPRAATTHAATLESSTSSGSSTTSSGTDWSSRSFASGTGRPAR